MDNNNNKQTNNEDRQQRIRTEDHLSSSAATVPQSQPSGSITFATTIASRQLKEGDRHDDIYFSSGMLARDFTKCCSFFTQHIYLVD